MTLIEHDGAYVISLAGKELMHSRSHASESLLGSLGVARLDSDAAGRVLIGGLGLGYTLKSALASTGEKVTVEVAEMVAEVIAWNRVHLNHHNGSLLDDPRVEVKVADVVQLIRKAKPESYDAILLDVDNGPQAMFQEGNDWIYSNDGLQTSFKSLRPLGVLSIWSTNPDPPFTKRLIRTGFKVEEVKARARRGRKGGGHYYVWVATRS